MGLNMKKLVLFLILIFQANIALAGGQKPDDVQPYVAQPITYASGATLNVVNTGTPPAYATMPANIPTASPTGWTVSGSIAYCSFSIAGDGSHGCANGQFGVQAKARFQANYKNILFDDPVRNYKEPGTSHCHIGYGNTTWNAWTTYKTLRNRPDSTAAGGVLNASGYWQPCWILTNPFSDGKNYAWRPDFATFYYTGAATTANPTGQEVDIPVGLRFVWGTNMGDPNDNAALARIAAANAQPGTSGRYSYLGNGYDGIYCNDGNGEHHSYTKTAGGADAFTTSTGVAGTCPSSAQMYFQANSGACWDGVNLWSPSGYDHVIQEIYDNVAGKPVCPNNWFRIFKIELKSLFTHQGFAGPTGYGAARLASDDMAATVCGCTILNGQSFHADYVMGWDDIYLKKVEAFCVGTNGNTGHECNNSTLDLTNRLITGENAPDGSRSPQLPVINYGSATAGVMFLLPSTSNGPSTHHSHQ